MFAKKKLTLPDDSETLPVSYRGVSCPTGLQST